MKFHMLLLGTLSTLVAIPLFSQAADPTLESRIAPIAKEHKGKIAVAIKHLITGEEYYLNADEAMPTASLIKTAVMVETYWQADEGKVKLDTMLTLKDSDKVPGAGVLTDSFSAGATLALKDAVRLMITVSDNTATNLVLDQIGIASTNTRMEKLGLKNTKIHAKVYKGKDTTIDAERTARYGLGSTTAKEMVQLFELIYQGKIVNPKACQEMLGTLLKNKDNELLVRYLPPGVTLAHKTGAVSNARTDAGIVYFRDPTDKKVKPQYVICVLTDKNEDQRWLVDNTAQLTISNIGKATYDHFSVAKP